jgi:3',5'-nucleoside bisphosphate phosphatase
MLNDLHIHTTYSDGAFTPDEIIEMAREKGIRYISITDHDTMGAYGNFSTDYEDLTIITGVEVSTYYKGLELHILSYFHNPHDETLLALLDRFKTDRVERYHKILRNLEGLDILLPDEAPPQDSYGRAHIAKLLIEHGYVKTIKEAFNVYLDVDKIAYEKRFKIDTREALKALRDAGGIPVLAHPGEKLYNLHFEQLLAELKVHGLLGLEVYHPSHRKELTNKFYALAKKHKMVISGGSDFHGQLDLKKNSFNDKLGRFGLNEHLMMKLIIYNRNLKKIK